MAERWSLRWLYVYLIVSLWTYWINHTLWYWRTARRWTWVWCLPRQKICTACSLVRLTRAIARARIHARMEWLLRAILRTREFANINSEIEHFRLWKHGYCKFIKRCGNNCYNKHVNLCFRLSIKIFKSTTQHAVFLSSNKRSIWSWRRPKETGLSWGHFYFMENLIF